MTPARSVLIVAIVGAALMATLAIAPSQALLTGTAGVDANTITTATLHPATNLDAAAACNGASPEVTLTWTASSSTFADGYDILRSGTSGGPYTAIAHVSGRATTTSIDGDVTTGTTYFYVVRATASAWISSATTERQATTPSLCV